MEPIDPALLATVTGGMQFEPSLLATMSSLVRRNRSVQPDPQMQKAVLAIGTAISNLTTSINQTKEQSSAAMMQMLPAMMGR